jgi:hypothetical protein
MSVSSPRTGGPTLARVRGTRVGDGRAVCLEALGVHFDIICAGSGADELASAVAKAWDWCLVDPAYAGRQRPLRRLTVVVGEPGEPAARTTTDTASDRASDTASDPLPDTLSGPDLATVMDRLTPTVTWRALTERRSDLVMFHACAVADPESGHAVALYGPSGTGKTTMARALCTDLVYLSDETAALDADLHVVPYPKPLSILTGGPGTLKDQVSPGQLGLVRPTGSVHRLRGLVQLRRDPTLRGEAVIEQLATVDALPELVAQTSFTRDMARPLHQLADLARRTGGVRRVTYAEAEQVRPLIGSILDGGA